MLLNEVHRSSLVAKSSGNVRTNKRMRVSVIKTPHSLDRVDMNKLFKKDIIEVTIPIKGETDNYDVIISFGGVLERIRSYLKTDLAHITRRGNYDPTASLTYNMWVKALKECFDREDIYCHCSCPDFRYRFAYWSTVNKHNSGEPEHRPSDITNPHDKLGGGCKHILNVLKNVNWILRLASIIYNYIRVLEKQKPALFDKIIRPALFSEVDAIISRQKYGSVRITEPSSDVKDVEDEQGEQVEEEEDGDID